MENPCEYCELKNSQEVGFNQGIANFDAEIVIVGESPGRKEELEGKVFVGPTGKLLMQELRRLDIERRSVFLMNAARCRLDKDKLSGGQISSILGNCRYYAELVLNKLEKKKIIICLGAIAFQQVFVKKMALKKARNQLFWSNEFNCYVVVTYHPAFTLRNPNALPMLQNDLNQIKKFIDNGYVEKEEIKYKEVQSIRPILDGDCYKEGDFYLSGIDTETQGILWHDPNSIIVSYQVSRNLHEGWTVILHEEVEKDAGDFNIFVQRGGTKKNPEYEEIGVKRAENYEQKVEELREFCARKDIKKYFANIKYEMHRFRNLGITEFNSFVFDVFVAAHTLDSELYKRPSLDDLIVSFTTASSHKNLVNEAEKADMLKLVRTDRERFLKYSSLDPCQTLLVALELKRRLMKDEKSLNYFINFAMPAERDFLYEVERNGVNVDLQAVPEVKKEITDEMAKTVEDFKKLCPKAVYEKHKNNFKLSRNIILKEALFTWTDTKLRKSQEKPEVHEYGFNIKPPVLSKETGEPSTDEKQALKTILDGKYPKKAKNLIETHLHWAKLSKLLTNYIKNIEQYTTKDGVLHASFSITGTSSGRVACKSPNLMNQPKRGPLAKYIRKLFKAPEGRKLCEIDYSASEIKFVAQRTADSNLVKVLNKGKDIHLATGLAMKGLPYEYEFETTKEKKDLRQSSKCFHPDTEVLTEHGWKKMYNLTCDDTIFQAVPHDKKGIILEKTKPSFFEIKKNHCDTLIHMKNEGIDLRVTPDHRMLGITKIENYRVYTPFQLESARYYPNSGYYFGQEENINERILRLVVATQADGSFQNKGIRFGFKKQHKINRLLSLLNNDEYSINEIGVKYIYTNIRLKKELSSRIKKYLDDDKTFNWKMLNLPLSSKNIILDEIQYWDAHKADNCNMFVYSSTIEKNIDIVQAIASTSNRKTIKTISKDARENHNPAYSLTIRVNNKSRTGNIQYEEYLYKEDIAVLSVPSTYVLVRDGGVPVITGQSVNFGALYKISPPGFARHADQNYGVKLSIKQAKKKLTDFYGLYPGIPTWHKESEKFARKNGYVRSMFGRIRWGHNLRSNDDKVQDAEIRSLLNFEIQSPSSDHAILAGLGILNDPEIDTNNDIKIVLFLHDAVYFSIREDKLHKLLPKLKRRMENPEVEKHFGIKKLIPTTVEVEVGDNLAEMEEVAV